MFNKHTDTRVDTLICGELRTAKEQYGETFNSLHEAYAVALEELEEASENVDMCKCWYKEIWDYIKWDEKESRLVEPLKEVRKYTVEAIKELAQLAAMVDKTLESMKIEDAKRENKNIGDAEVL
jgi:hypothetical protein